MVSKNEMFEDFLSRRESISAEYINGDADSLLGVSTSTDPATFFPPSGARIRGADRVNAANEDGAQAFSPGSSGRFEILQSWSSGDLGFWAGIQHAEVMLQGKDVPVAMQLRTTEVFRREDGDWKLVHRHADMLEPEG
jgi:ketosteroid isomerase-like protein